MGNGTKLETACSSGSIQTERGNGKFKLIKQNMLWAKFHQQAAGY